MEIVNLVDLYLEKGLPPVGGGVMDQSQYFFGCLQFVSGDQVQHRHRQNQRSGR